MLDKKRGKQHTLGAGEQIRQRQAWQQEEPAVIRPTMRPAVCRRNPPLTSLLQYHVLGARYRASVRKVGTGPAKDFFRASHFRNFCFSYSVVGSEDSQKRAAARAHQIVSCLPRRTRANGPNIW